MRRISRLPLPQRAQGYLDRQQARLDDHARLGVPPGAQSMWRSARQAKAVGAARDSVLSTLREMTGHRVRCMYCVDSLACDIEHFWPKLAYPASVFRWPNLLLCCTDCGRRKGDRLVLAPDGQPWLIDPTAEDPWEYLDFDPDTGSVFPRFDIALNADCRKGMETVSVFMLDRREPLTEGYRSTYRRLASAVVAMLNRLEVPSSSTIMDELEELDDHGLLPWCFSASGSTCEPFLSLKRIHTELWERCAERVVTN